MAIPAGDEGGAERGQMVTLELTRWPTPTRGPLGRVSEVLGDIDAPGVDTQIIIRKFGIPDRHSDEAVAGRARGACGRKERQAGAGTFLLGCGVACVRVGC